MDDEHDNSRFAGHPIWGGMLVATPCLFKRKQFIFHSELVYILIALGIVDLSVMRVMFLAGKQVHTCTIAAVALAASKIVGSRHG